MRLAKRRIARRIGFEKCLIPWKELIPVTYEAFFYLLKSLIEYDKSD